MASALFPGITFNEVCFFEPPIILENYI